MFDLLHYASGIIEEADNPFIQIDLKDLDKKIDYPELLPVLPIKNTVLFPGVVIPITVNRFKSIRAVEDAYTSDKMIMVLTQIKQDVDGDVAFRSTMYHLLILFASLGRHPGNLDAASVRRRTGPGLSAKPLDGCGIFPMPALHTHAPESTNPAGAMLMYQSCPWT